MTQPRPILGVNLPWFFGAYGHDLADNEHHPTWGNDYDDALAARALEVARGVGFDAVRVWLCEHGEGVVTRGSRVVGVRPELLDRVARVQDLASAQGLRVYWSLLDANSWKREGDALTHAVMSDVDSAARFAEHVAAPIARRIDASRAVGLEVLNEPEVMTAECLRPGEDCVAWSAIGASLRVVGDAIRAATPGLRVTSGTMHVFLPRLWASGAALDAADIHVYHEDGGLPPPARLAAEVGDPRIAHGEVPLIAGECGLPEHATEPWRLVNYLYNAVRHGYAGAFLWRLENPLVTRDGAWSHAAETVHHALSLDIARAAREGRLRP